MAKKLYWYTTPGNTEDWFYVASSKREVRAELEDDEPELTDIELVCKVPDAIEADVGWPSLELLEQLGGKVLHREQPRSVEITGRTFTEGMLESVIQRHADDQFEQMGEGRPNRTPRRKGPS